MNSTTRGSTQSFPAAVQRLVGGFLALVFALLGVAGVALADDTEIYQAAFDSGTAGRPKVLIVIDDSFSMETTVTMRTPYDPNTTYSGVHSSGRLYWSDTGEPPRFNSNRWVPAGANRCAASVTPLAQQGFYQGRLLGWYERYLRFLFFVVSEGWRWGSLDAPLFRSNDNFTHLECRTDVNTEDPTNPGHADGYPQNTTTNGQEYGDSVDNNVSFDSAYTLYTHNYMNWYYDDSQQEVLGSRLQVAKDVITDVVEANPGIDFGLAVFNNNTGSSDDGGRIVQGIVENMDSVEVEVDGEDVSLRDKLVGTIDNDIEAGGSTPLCETTYEMYRYLAGESVLYGREAGSETPERDTSDQVETGGTNPDYISPATDCAYTYLILLTDGRPTRDTDANSRIKALPGVDSCETYLTDETDFLGRPRYAENCLPQLAWYMANNDLDGDPSNGDQFGITYVIGFLTDQLLLSDTAEQGDGQYFTADDPESLSFAFTGAVTEILETDSTFTSPAVAVDTFTRTRSLDQVFFAMFKPGRNVDWPGNIKRLGVALIEGETLFVDANGDPAIDDANSQILETAVTAWGDEEDGPDVLQGGVGALLAERTPSTRELYTNTGPGGALESFQPDNIDPEAFGFDVTNPGNPGGELLDFFGASTEQELHNLIRWAAGYQISEDGSSVIDVSRGWLLSDILHSQPVIVNYGEYGNATADNPDTRILVGTNGGFLHMFNNAGFNSPGSVPGDEDWAFFPKELGPILKQRRENAISAEHVYGIDAPPVIYTLDTDLDGTLDHNDGDKVYVFFGLRRGGQLMYALDISDPANPALLWQIDPTTEGFSELGYTWSTPVVTTIPGYYDDSEVPKPKPVLVFGAGYDENKDNPGVVTPDNIGRGIFIVDAETGALVWSITPGADSDTNLQELALQHSVAAEVTVLDSNGNNRADRIYFSDTGGHLWRVDLPGDTLPADVDDLPLEARPAVTWRITQIASVNESDPALDDNNGVEAIDKDRRFFNGIDVVRTSCGGLAFDALIIGSGDRANPLGTDVNNQLYMFRDLRLSPYITDPPEADECLDDDESEGVNDFRCELPLGPDDLFDVTSNVLETATGDDLEAAEIALFDADGWVLNLVASGEKSLARTLTLGGKIFAPTFQPDAVDPNVCAPTPGSGKSYAIRLCDATSFRDWDQIEGLDRTFDLAQGIPERPSVYVDEQGRKQPLFTGKDPLEIDEELSAPRGTYWFREEK